MENQIIHVVLGKANPNRMNGVNKMVNSLAENQAALGQKVSVWGITKHTTHNYPPRIYQTQLFTDVAKFTLSGELKKAIAKLDKGTTFHLHGGFLPQLFRLAKLLCKYKIPYIFTPHGAYNSIALERSAFKKKVYIKVFESYVVRNAKTIHLIGESEIGGTKRIFKKLSYRLIPNGQEISKKFSEPSRIGNTHPVFGFVGRLDMYTKGLDLLLLGFAQFVEKSSFSCQLWIIGDGPDRELLELMARNLKIDRYMKFYGAKYGIEKDELICQMDYLCLTSRNEGLPGVVLEAAALSVPVIVSPETNIGSYVEKANAGFVVPKNTADFIAHVIGRAFRNKVIGKSKEQASAAKNMVKNHFNWEKIALQHLEMYA